MSEDTERFLLVQKNIFQISILSRKFKLSAHNSIQLIQILCSLSHLWSILVSQNEKGELIFINLYLSLSNLVDRLAK